MEGSEWERANCFDKFTFRVVNDLIRRGIQKALQYDDIMKLPSSNRSSLMVDQLDEQYRRSQPFWIVPKLITALIWCHLPVVILVNILGFMEGVVRIASPVVLGFLLKAMQSSSRTKEAFVYAGILAALNLAQTVIHHILFFYSMDMGWKAKTATIGLIFRQLFRITASFQSSNSELSSSGRLVNLISNDVARFELFATFSFFAYISLFELAAILIILCFYLNVAAGFAGVFMTIACIPAQVYFASLIARFRRAIGACTDQRVRFISEVIEGISTVKCYGWEIPFYSLIGKFRQKEMKFIDRSLDVKSVNLALYYFSPPLACFATFSVFWGTGGTLTFPLVFSTISLLLQLRTSIGRQWTIAMESSSEAFASCARVEAFLDVFLETGADANGGRLQENSAKVETTTKKADFANNSQIELTSLEQKPMSPDIVAIRTSAYSYSNGAGDSSVVLKDVSLSVQAGELMMIVGAVGSGKSTLLNVILGELKAVGDPEGNSRWMKPGIRLAYCAQKPWILAASVKSNIVLAGAASAEDEEDAINVPNSLKICSLKFPREINSKLYKRALSCCRINEDINLWASGDETEIGERGISISGGQKARLGLARAVYADADLYVLDDVLSAVDAHVGKALFEDCILGALRDRNKAVILATHQSRWQLFFGTYSDLCKSDCVIPGVAASSAPVDAVSDRVGGKARAMSDTSACSDSSCADPAVPEAEGGKSSKKAFEGVQAEDRVEGSLSWAVISKYIHSGGTILGSSALFIAVCSQVLLMMTDYWLKWWASGFFWKQDNHNNLGIYGGLVGLCIIFGFLRSFAWFRFSQNAAQSLHERALWAIFHAPMHFFVSNPSGRILNRFSRDQNQVDELLPYTMFDCLQSLLFSIASVILVCVTIPWLIILVVPMIYAFYWLRNQYIQSSRELKRLEATLRSPIYADFSATLDGLVTLRAYQLEGKVTKSFQRHLDRNTRAFFSFLMVSRWLGFRLDLESALLVTAVALLSVGLRDQVDVGLLGLALTYTMALSGLLQWATRQSGETENMLTSVERLSSYALLEPEPGYHVTLSMYQDSRNIENHSSSVAKRSSANKAYEAVAHGVEDPPSSNAVQGLAVQLRDCFVKYRDDLDPVLRNFSVDFPAGAKVGICGRTGSGKSSTLLALLRLNIVSSGSIIVGDKSLLDMDLESARGCISVIPQEPHLFSGTIRFNLDPFSNYSDAELWDALEDACIKDTISKDPKGLDGVVEDNGKNFSVGQRQLLSMARAILRKCPVILMDEVTASIDYETDRLIQQTIRTSSALRSCTIITVAHRLRTIADSDLIVVVNGGEIAEVGSPQVLLRTEDSLFKGLALQSNEMDEIVRIANSKSS